MPDIIDIHVHFGSPRDEKTGCYWSGDFEKTAAFVAMLLVTKSLFKKVSPERLRKVILGTINKSKYVHKSVVLALDEVYDQDGVKHPEWTHMHVPNSYVAQLASENERILFGASVHPYRDDWQEELEFCLQNGAVLCKWIPSSQQIDPSHHKCLDFFRLLAKHNLPLLCHAGPEYTIPTSNKEYIKFNNPLFLKNALNIGVKVIVAHCALPYFGAFENDYIDDYDDFKKMLQEADEQSWNLYADLSAVATTVRAFYLKELVPQLDHQRLLFGSDYPIPASILSYNKIGNIFSWIKYLFKQVLRMSNALDKNYKIIRGMKFDDVVFTNAAMLFDQIKR